MKLAYVFSLIVVAVSAKDPCSEHETLLEDCFTNGENNSIDACKECLDSNSPEDLGYVDTAGPMYREVVSVSIDVCVTEGKACAPCRDELESYGRCFIDAMEIQG